MTVNTVDSIAEFVTNGVTTNFPFYFKFLANEDLVVTYIDPLGVSTTLTLGTNYTANGAGNDQGSIVTTVALAGPGQLTVSREMEAFQQTSLRNQGKFLAETHEDVFDKLTMLIQQGLSTFKRALTRPFGRDYFDAENRLIKSVKDPVEAQDAATKHSVEAYVSSILATGQGPINNAANVMYAPASGVVRTVASKLQEVISVKDFGAKGDGVTDDAASIQAALNYIASLTDGGAYTGGTLFVPPGQYLVNTRLNYSGASLRIVGAGEFATVFLSNNANGLLNYSAPGPIGTFSTKLEVSEFSIIPRFVGSNGDAIYASWAQSAWNSATPHFTAFKVTIRSKNYGSEDGAYFANHYRLRNSASTVISHCYGWDFGLTGAYIWIDNDNTFDRPSFAHYVTNCSFNHGNGTTSVGVKATGWFEDINILQCAINGQWRNIVIDATGSPITTNPNVTIVDLTANAKKTGIYIYRCASVKLTNVDIFHGTGQTDVDGNGGACAMIECKRIQIDSSKFLGLGAIQAGWVPKFGETGLSIANCQSVSCSNSHFINNTDNGIVISGDSCTDIEFNGNSIFNDDGMTTGTGVLIQNSGVTARVRFNDTKFKNLGIGYTVVDAGGVYLTNDMMDSVSSKYIMSGSVAAAPVAVEGSKPAPGRVVISGATPSIRGVPDGRLIITNASATTVTNFLKGYEGQWLDIYFSNGNTTIAHNGTIFLQGSTSATFGAGTFLRLRLDGSTWIEQSRRT